MDEEIKKEFEHVWTKIRQIEEKFDTHHIIEDECGLNFSYNFQNKKLSHNELLAELLKSEECHHNNGISREEILRIFKENGRPVVPKKVNNLLGIWKKRKKIEAVKEGKKLKYFWIENETNTSK